MKKVAIFLVVLLNLSFASQNSVNGVAVTTNPVANAGDDQTIKDNDGNGKESVTLDGRASYHPDPSRVIQSYTWKDGDTQIATGYNPTIDMNVGIYTITLIVTDDLGATGSDEVIINIEECSASMQDSLALVALYDSTNGDSWTDNTNWLNADSSISTWYGVTVDDSGRVTIINLKNNNLNGTLPANLANLTKLTILNLAANNLSGNIPPELGELSDLRGLHLYSNQLSETIPSELGNLTKLTDLYLYHNKLSGNIPSELGDLTNLNRLFLYSNKLSGNVPPELGNLTKMTNISLYDNNLTGEVPAELGNLIGLEYLYLHINQLSGSIPPELGNLNNLRYFNLSANELTGEIPTELENLSNLQFLYLQTNHLSGNIPTGLDSLSNLIGLYLSSNELTGSIPTELGNLTNLKYLLFSSNQLSGYFPAEITKLTNLQYLYVDNNKLNGSIPDSIIKLTNLTSLLLRNNDFDQLPDLSSLSNLTKVWAESNKFTFEDLEANIGISDFTYNPQDSVGKAIDSTVTIGSSYSLSIEVGGTANVYQWYKDGVAIVGADSCVYEISSVSLADSGKYSCRITNTIVMGLTLYSRPATLHIQIATGVENSNTALPTSYSLEQNYPNPFNPSTMIKYGLPEQARVKISIYDIRGRRVVQLLDAQKTAGYHTVKFDASALSAGLYFYVIDAEKFHQVKKMMLIK